jgi:protein SCO1/2
MRVSRTKGKITLTLVVMAALLAACSSSSTSAPPASVGAIVKRIVPTAIRQLPLTDQTGRSVDLASWSNKTVLLVPFLTLCADICPMTTANLLEVERSLHADKAASKVVIVELSVDPGRDTPTRLAAYAKLTGAHWQLVTETPANLAAIAKFFGFNYEKVPEDNPPDIDWLTGKPLTYDIDHSDGFVIINPKGVERFVTASGPNFHGRLNGTLEKFLSPLGHKHLAHAPLPNWTPGNLLEALSWSMHLPLASSS